VGENLTDTNWNNTLATVCSAAEQRYLCDKSLLNTLQMHLEISQISHSVVSSRTEMSQWQKVAEHLTDANWNIID
jgi:hypothetical protein